MHLIITSFLFLCSGCNSLEESNKPTEKTIDKQNEIQIQISSFRFNPSGVNIETRFEVSIPITRMGLKPNSFGAYLRTLPLKPYGEKVMLFNGEEKWDKDVAAAVINLPIGKRDLHQCADGIMHLKARYHFEKQEYNKIGFHFVNGFYCDFEHWKNGFRVSVKGNKTNWYKATKADSSEKTFWKYMEMVFAYAGTLSLAKELNPTELKNIKIGDVFIVGGSPGHAIIVVDMAENKSTGEKYFLLAQSYMPAQELHVLNNYGNEKLSPWYSVNKLENGVSTPEWSFDLENLKGF